MFWSEAVCSVADADRCGSCNSIITLPAETISVADADRCGSCNRRRCHHHCSQSVADADRCGSCNRGNVGLKAHNSVADADRCGSCNLRLRGDVVLFSVADAARFTDYPTGHEINSPSSSASPKTRLSSKLSFALLVRLALQFLKFQKQIFVEPSNGGFRT